MELFELKNGSVTFSPIALALKPFRKLWDRDKTKTKAVANGELAAVYFFSDYKSDFSEILDEAEKIDTIKQATMGLPAKWKPDTTFYEAVEFYKERRSTVSTVLLEDARAAVSKISQFLRDIDLNETDANNKPVHDAKKVADTIGNLSKVVDSLKSLEDKVKREQQSNDSLRGGHDKSIMEDGA